jgi:hypothetical protein
VAEIHGGMGLATVTSQSLILSSHLPDHHHSRRAVGGVVISTGVVEVVAISTGVVEAAVKPLSSELMTLERLLLISFRFGDLTWKDSLLWTLASSEYQASGSSPGLQHSLTETIQQSCYAAAVPSTTVRPRHSNIQ